MPGRARPLHFLAWSAIFSIAACNAIWGIDDGTLAGAELVQAGASGNDAGGAPPEAGGTSNQAGETGESSGGAAPAVGGEGGSSAAGMSSETGGSSTTAGSGGSMTAGTAGTAPSCTGCKEGEKQTENQSCGRCGTGTQSRARTCDANCSWSAWSEWSPCSQCDAKPYRCCGNGGQWEWCYDSDCAWTNDCEPCVASSCPECH